MEMASAAGGSDSPSIGAPSVVSFTSASCPDSATKSDRGIPCASATCSSNGFSARHDHAVAETSLRDFVGHSDSRRHYIDNARGDQPPTHDCGKMTECRAPARTSLTDDF